MFNAKSTKAILTVAVILLAILILLLLSLWLASFVMTGTRQTLDDLIYYIMQIVLSIEK